MRRTTVVLQVLDLHRVYSALAQGQGRAPELGARFKVMQRRCPNGRAASHSEAAAGRSAVKEQRRTRPPVNRERKGQTQQVPDHGICCLAAMRSGLRMSRPTSPRSASARPARGWLSAVTAAGLVPGGARRRSAVARGREDAGAAAVPERVAARRPTVVMVAPTATPAA